MKPLDKIYAITQVNRIIGCSEKPFKYSEEYIRKDLLLAWLNGVKSDPMIPMNIDKVIDYIKAL